MGGKGRERKKEIEGAERGRERKNERYRGGRERETDKRLRGTCGRGWKEIKREKERDRNDT